MTRKDYQFMALTEEIARIFSTCAKRQYGAVIVDRRYRVIGLGYNGSAAGEPHCIDGACPRLHQQSPSGSSYENCIAAHAEANAIINSGYSSSRCDATMYVNGSPCWNCATHILSAGISRIVCKADESYEQWPIIYQRLRQGGIWVDIFEEKSVAGG